MTMMPLYGIFSTGLVCEVHSRASSGLSGIGAYQLTCAPEKGMLTLTVDADQNVAAGEANESQQ